MTVVHEYESREMSLTRNQALGLQQTGFVEVAPSSGDRWKVTATAYVGSLVVDGFKLLVRPKINPENLFLLLEPGLPPQAWRQEAFDYDASSDLLPAVVSFFARTVETTLRRGVLRSYEPREESLVALRGRLNTSSLFNQAGLLTPVPCSYDDFSEDVFENRILKAAIRLALKVPRLASAVRQRLMRQIIALELVSDVIVRPENVDSIHFSRLNEHYKPALGLARLLLANLTLTDGHGTNNASSFMVNMNDLFQRFVTERLRIALRGHLSVVDEPTVHLGLAKQVPMQPDLEFRNLSNQLSYVGDIKYKISNDARGRSSDYYQLLAYTTAMDLPEGVLIYCRRKGSKEQRTVTVRNNSKRLVLRSVDLTGSSQEVDHAMQETAEAIVIAARR